MDEPVGRQHLAALSSVNLRAVEVRDSAAGLFYEQAAGAGVPRVQLELPEAVQLGHRRKATSSAAVQRRRDPARRPCVAHAARELLVEVHVPGLAWRLWLGKPVATSDSWSLSARET